MKRFGAGARGQAAHVLRSIPRDDSLRPERDLLKMDLISGKRAIIPIPNPTAFAINKFQVSGRRGISKPMAPRVMTSRRSHEIGWKRKPVNATLRKLTPTIAVDSERKTVKGGPLRSIAGEKTNRNGTIYDMIPSRIEVKPIFIGSASASGAAAKHVSAIGGVKLEMMAK